MNVIGAIGLVSACGAVGGLVAYLSTSGLRTKLSLQEGPSEVGFVSSTVLGAVAAALAWALQSPHDAMLLTGSLASDDQPRVADLVAAVGVGLAGSKWLVLHFRGNVMQFLGSSGTANGAEPSAALALASGDVKSAARTLELT